MGTLPPIKKTPSHQPFPQKDSFPSSLVTRTNQAAINCLNQTPIAVFITSNQTSLSDGTTQIEEEMKIEGGLTKKTILTYPDGRCEIFSIIVQNRKDQTTRTEIIHLKKAPGLDQKPQLVSWKITQKFSEDFTEENRATSIDEETVALITSYRKDKGHFIMANFENFDWSSSHWNQRKVTFLTPDSYGTKN